MQTLAGLRLRQGARGLRILKVLLELTKELKSSTRDRLALKDLELFTDQARD